MSTTKETVTMPKATTSNERLIGRVKWFNNKAGYGFVTVTEVRVTGDLREATVFYTVLGEEENRLNTKKALESAKGMLRSEVGKVLGIKHTPSLTFIHDAIPENAVHISEVLRTAQKRDEELHAIAKSGKYAAGEDPYKHKERDESR